jgi:hypothetical protein
MGRFRFGDLADGPYVLTVSLAGFRTRTLDVQVGSTASPEVVVTLTTAILSEVLWVVPPPADAYRTAAAIAHIRINRTRLFGPCGDSDLVTARHEASALRIFKGAVPPRIELHQEAAGRCSERGQWHEGMERPYRAGEEYVVFLARRADGFGRLAGPSLAFRVRGELVSLGGFAGIQGSISLNELNELLDNLSRKAPLAEEGKPPRARAVTPGRR